MKKISVSLFILMALVSLTLPLKAQDKDSAYKKEEILFMKWGDGENEVGLKEKHISYKYMGVERKSVNRTVPNQIEVDGVGNVYIADMVHKKAVKFNHQTKKIERFESNNGHLKIKADREQEGLYIFNNDDNSVDIIKPGKERVRKKLTKKTLDDVIKERIVIKNKLLVKRKGGKAFLNLSDSSQKINQSPQMIDPSVVVFNTLRRESVNDQFSFRFRNLKQLGAPCDEIIYKSDAQLSRSYFLDIDANNNIYYLFNKTPEFEGDYRERFVVKLDIINCEITLTQLEPDYFYNFGPWPKRFVEVDMAGNIYQLLTKEDGVHVIRWSQKE